MATLGVRVTSSSTGPTLSGGAFAAAVLAALQAAGGELTLTEVNSLGRRSLPSRPSGGKLALALSGVVGVIVVRRSDGVRVARLARAFDVIAPTPATQRLKLTPVSNISSSDAAVVAPDDACASYDVELAAGHHRAMGAF